MIRLTDQTKVSIVTGLCLLGLVIVLKSVLRVPADILSRDMIIYIIIYSSLFSILLQLKDEDGKRSKYDRPLYWSLLIIPITVAIVVLYALL